MEKRILILGANGLFGTAMKRTCRDAEVDYVALGHEDLEITDRGQLEERIREHNPQIIINSVVVHGINRCEESPLKTFDINSISALNLARICQEDGRILVQASSSTVFDGEKEGPYYEEDVPNPINVYGLSKYMGERCVQNNCEGHYIIRFPKLFGPKDKGPGFFNKVIQKIRRGEGLRISDERFEPFTYTLDAAREVLSLIQNQGEFGIYHLANTGFRSYYDFTCELARRMGYEGEIIRAKEKDFQTIVQNPLRVELKSKKIPGMRDSYECLDEFIKGE